MLKTWQHPKTGEIRVYVNDSRLWGGARVYFFERPGDFADCRVEARDPAARRQAERVANEIGESVRGSWSALLAAAS
jgi:hypothetical protein